MDRELVRRTRLERGWSREKLAAEAGVSLNTIRNIELGPRLPTAENLRAVATALGLTLDEIYPAEQVAQ
jgi:transcriptional regulator with XRE-family HTH domain